MAEQLTAIGTGFAIASKCYTTCFTISDGNEHFMIDTGGGSGVLTNLEKLDISYNQVHHIFCPIVIPIISWALYGCCV